MIYLDNAATTPLDECVLREMSPYLTQFFGNSQSQHAYGRRAQEAIASARDKIAGLAGCKSEEIYFVSGGTEAGNMALKGACLAHSRGRILISAIEHPCVSESAEAMRALGFEVDTVEPDKDGVINPESVARAIRADTVFCAVMSANNETGVVQPAEEIGKICVERGVTFYTDCVQSAGFMPLPAGRCDMFGFSAHKLYGPKGIGALYVRQGVKLSPLITGGRQERGLRGGTLNTAQIVGLACAYENAVKDMHKNTARIAGVRNRFVSRVLAEISGTALNGGGSILPSHANISFEGCDGANILFALDLQGIATSTGSACSAGATKPSRVISAMAGEARAQSAVRFTFGKYNTEEEADRAVEALKQIVCKIRTAK